MVRRRRQNARRDKSFLQKRAQVHLDGLPPCHAVLCAIGAKELLRKSLPVRFGCGHGSKDSPGTHPTECHRTGAAWGRTEVGTRCRAVRAEGDQQGQTRFDCWPFHKSRSVMSGNHRRPTGGVRPDDPEWDPARGACVDGARQCQLEVDRNC